MDQGGDVWVGGEVVAPGELYGAIEIRRYNARGIVKGSIDVTGPVLYDGDPPCPDPRA